MEAVRRRLGHEQVSERRACEALGQPRGTQRYKPKQPEKDRPLIETMRKIVERRPGSASRVCIANC